MYRDVLQVSFPENASAVYVAVVIRHDIVHRSGKTKGGKTHNLRESDVEKLFAGRTGIELRYLGSRSSRK